MKRRTLKRLRPGRQPDQHHNVYVVLLDPAVGRLRSVRAANSRRDPKKPCVYVGMTGLTPEERFANHKAGIKDASLVKRYGLRLVPELYAHLNPMPFEAAIQMEVDLAGVTAWEARCAIVGWLIRASEQKHEGPRSLALNINGGA